MADILKANFFVRPKVLFKSFTQTKWAKNYFFKNLPKKGKTVVSCAFLRSKTKILRNFLKFLNDCEWYSGLKWFLINVLRTNNI